MFLDWPDAAPLAQTDPAYAKTLARLTEWAADFLPQSLWSSWHGEPHCDHVAAHELAANLAAHLPSVTAHMEFLVWGWSARRARFDCQVAWSLACADSIELRQRALACHQTQMSDLINDARKAFRIPPQLVALTDRPVEIYLQAR
jgi:LmbE family N-acetylglucosaminyl deacetylase